MVDRHREESPGAWHHVMNRGTARRTVIEGHRDAEVFLVGVQRVVEEGLLEVHTYCLMATHFHMLVRSPQGELSRAMMLVQNLYARWFNRGRHRDGPLWRGRFLSKLVCSEDYWDLLVGYIDHNPVEAHIVAVPESYGLGSAWHYSRSSAGPAWLCRGEIERIVRTRVGKSVYEPSDYRTVFGRPLSRSACWMLGRHGFSRGDVEETFTALVSAAPDTVRAWMERKARLADGVPAVGVGVIDPDVLLAAAEAMESADPELWIHAGRRRRPGWRALRCALLHQVCGCTIEDIGMRVGIGASTVARHVNEHAALVLGNTEYERRSCELLSNLLQAEHGGVK